MNLLKQLYQLLARVTFLRRKYIYQTALNSIGMDASPLDRADDVLGCAESVTEILVKAGAIGGVITGTYTLERYLQRSKNWVVTQTPQAGDIIISATGTGNGKIRGHVGIWGENGVIMSNDSLTGKWMANYTLDTWNDRYKNIGGFPVTSYTFFQMP